ncbi:MAG: UDP-N-acetylmuramate dehydrogenase, partial [Patescibacteria group bacterium]|nr:UDP-N-acetylmuramate dehydrogenase [Patescibacteria group bacterium]
RGLPSYVLGGGSNVLAADDGYAGVIIRMNVPGIAEEAVAEDAARLIAGAGVSWDTLVAEAARRGLWGVENLAGIPGTAGAAPVQNIGAYGTELSGSLEWIDAVPAAADRVERLAAAELALAYRDSRLKREKGWTVLRIALRLRRDGAPMLAYRDLASRKEAGEPLRTPAEVGRAVREIRAGKFPDLSVSGTAGSFFKNPVIRSAEAKALAERYPGLPVYPADEETSKVSLAWILDCVLDARGLSVGGARLFERQPIVIVAGDGATAKDVELLAETVARRVEEATGISIEREVRTLA